MAKSRRNKNSDKTAASGQTGHGALRVILVLTLLIVAAGLGLMAWNQHQTRDIETLKLLQRDALIAAERLNRKADDTSARLEFELRSGARIASIDPAYVGVDSLVTLPSAAASDETEMNALADYANALIADGNRLGQMDGKLVFVHVPAVGSALIGTADVTSWLSAPSSRSRLLLHGETILSLGNRSVLPPDRSIVTRGHGFRYAGLTERSATACVGLEKADFSLCLSNPAPLLTLETGLELLLYFLLMAAPALAVFGLYRALGKQDAESSVPAGSPASDDPFEVAATSVNIGFWFIRPADGTAWLNSEAARLLGLPDHGDYPIPSLYSQVHGPHRTAFEDAMDGARPSQPFAIQFATTFSGGEQWLEARGRQLYQQDDDSAIISGVFFDVTDLVRARERQRSAEDQLRRAIENFPCPFALWGPNKRLAFWNKAFEATFGLEDVLRQGVSMETVLLARSGNVSHERSSPLDAGVSLIGLRNGEWIKFVERKTPSGGLVSFGIDVTEDVRSEEQLTHQKKKLKTLVQELERSEGHNAELARKYNEEKAKAERSANTKSAFLANMSHELRTPLNAINGFSEILVNEMYGPLGDKRYVDYAHDILASGQHLLDLINDILDIAKIEAGKMTIDPKPIDLVDPVDAAVRMIRRKAEDKDVTLTLQAEDNLPEVDADHRAVRQMVLNLLSNAIKFTDSGGRILVGVQRKDGYVRVAVRDTGIGIPKEDLPRLAEPFEQVSDTRERNFDGTGLGLALTKSFAEMHGGRFTIASEIGKGTMVSFYLPVSQDSRRADLNVA